MDLHLYNYNNYYNRTIKPVGNTIAVQDLTENEVYIEFNVNFNPNDGITTEHIIGGINTYIGTADYAILADGDRPVSKWFIIENQRVRGGQYKITLKRDTVGEYLTNILEAPCFVEKGWVPDTDPAIFNHENMDFNQIKKSEVLLKDKTQIPWLVGYYAKDNTLTTNVPTEAINADYTVNGLSTWSYYDYTTQFYKSTSQVQLNLLFKGVDNNRLAAVKAEITDNGTFNIVESKVSKEATAAGLHYSIETGFGGYTVATNALTSLESNLRVNTQKLWTASLGILDAGDIIDNEELQELINLADRTVYDEKSGKLYKIGYDLEIGDTDYTKSVAIPLTSTLGYELYNVYAVTTGIDGLRPTSDSNYENFGVTLKKSNQIKLKLIEQSTKNYAINISPEGGAQTKNCPYNIFAMPYGEIQFGYNIDGEIDYKRSNADTSLRLCTSLISKYSGGESPVLLDVQLLPYCPIAAVREGMEDSSLPIFHLFDNDALGDIEWTSITDSDGNPVAPVFYVKDTQHKITIDYQIKVGNIKTSNETEMCRLVSPNWNGVFEFSPAKNYGVEYFIVDYELKPYNPYIHIAPKWNQSGLYGKRDNDPIGLICGGDFGLTMVSDAWATYERQNKNYQNIFDRQIQNLEVQQKYQRVGDIVGAVTGTASGAVAGGMTGAMVGGGYGAAIGAVSGGALSAAGGIIDYNLNEALRAEAMDYTKDLFGYQMGNIKALPQSLARVNSFNPNNTIFPILEFYGCTEKEIAALQNKIIYNGMSIGRIGQLKDYLNPLTGSTYVKGQIILLEGLEEDSHFAADIANEIYKGVRI